MRCCLIFNPSAKGDKARRFRGSLGVFGAGCALKLTSAPGDARRLAAEAVREGFETVVAAGGDGTVNEVLNGISDVPGGLAAVRLAVLPLGTVNVFARELGIPAALPAAWEVVQQGAVSRIDLPQAEFQSQGKTCVRLFAQLGGAGLDARAIELVDWPLKKKIGPLAYVYAGLRALAGPLNLIQAAGAGHAAEGQLVLIGNGRLYGGSYAVFPQADLRDGRLEVCVFPKVNWLTLARCGPGLLIRGRLPRTVTRTFQASTVTLTSNQRVAVELDGELVGNLPAQFSFHTEKLAVLVPAHSR